MIYCGDRWCDFGTHGIGYNQWVPLTMDGYTPHFNDLSQWRLDAKTGEWTIGDGNNYIANNEFDADRVDLNNLTGWECSDSLGGTINGNVKAKRFHGNYAARQSADKDYTARIKQTITDLPDGTYTLRASVMSSGGQNECVLYANTSGKDYAASLISKMSSWTDIVIKDIVVENGECEVGLYSDTIANNYVRIDDLYLTRNYDGTVIEGKMNTNVPELTEVYAENGVAITAEYENNGTFKRIESIQNVKAGDAVLTTPDTANTKMFVWDSLGGMRPIKTKKVTE